MNIFLIYPYENILQNKAKRNIFNLNGVKNSINISTVNLIAPFVLYFPIAGMVFEFSFPNQTITTMDKEIISIGATAVVCVPIFFMLRTAISMIRERRLS